MSIINELVYNRTQADVDRVYTLKNKILTGGLAALTAEEKASPPAIIEVLVKIPDSKPL